MLGQQCRVPEMGLCLSWGSAISTRILGPSRDTLLGTAEAGDAAAC